MTLSHTHSAYQPTPLFQTLFLARHPASPPLLFHLSSALCFPLPFSWQPILSPSFSVYPGSQSHPSSSVRDGHLCCLWWCRKTACISLSCLRQELPLLWYFSFRYLVWISRRKSWHRTHSLCSLTGRDQLRNSATKEQWIMDEVKLEVKGTEMLQLSSKLKYL